MRAFLMAGMAEHTGHGVPKIVDGHGRDSVVVSDGMTKATLDFTSKCTVAGHGEANRQEGCEPFG